MARGLLDGFRVFFGNKEIKNAADCRGIKLRVPEIPTWVEMARSLGIAVTAEGEAVPQDLARQLRELGAW